VLEKKGLGGAFSRSSELSRNRKRHIFNDRARVADLLGARVRPADRRRHPRQPDRPDARQRGGDDHGVPVVAITEALLYFDTRIKSEGSTSS
jgi:hypothetical protein